MDMTSGPLDSGPGPLPVLKTKDLKDNTLGGCIPSDEVHWMGDMEMQIFIIEFGTLLTVQCRETTATEPLPFGIEPRGILLVWQYQVQG